MTTDQIDLLTSGEYPTRWNAYVGQDEAKQLLQVSAKSARMRAAPLDHVLISHPTPGIGKTALAVLTAAEMRKQVRAVSGVVHADWARMLFAEMGDGDVLLWDEAHQMMDNGRKNAEWLLSFLQDGTIMGPLGAEVQPKVTVVAATTDPGRIPDAIVGRFAIRPPMRDYTTAEAAKIAIMMARSILIGPRLGKADATQLAAAGANNPRAIKQLLVVLRDMTITDTLPMKGTRYDVPGLLAMQGITSDGLDRTAQAYLAVLATEFGGTAGVKALEDRLQQPGGLATVERVLMDKGLIGRTARGRSLTQAGIRRYRELQEVAA